MTMDETTVAGPSAKSVHPLVCLAREAVETFVREKRYVSAPLAIEGEMAERAGVFVCLKRRGHLRGCIGTFEPAADSVAEETIQNAVSAAVRDPRFSPISADELHLLTYSVDVLTDPEPVGSPADLNPKRYGVIVRCRSRRGLLLPDLEGVDTVEEQIRIARRKAGIGSDEPVELYRFEVRRFE